MDHNSTVNTETSLRTLLLELARREDELADTEAAATPYWAPCPTTVVGRRLAARLLRAEADEFQLRKAS
jgi:hypothetical protein